MRHSTPSRSIEETWEGVVQGRIDLGTGLTHVLYRVLRRVSDRYTTLVEGLEERFESLDEEMFENPRDDLLEELLYYGISAISLEITGSDRREGLRACVSQISRDQFGDLEYRLKEFHHRHPP